MSSNPLIQDLIENEAFPSVTVALPTGGRWYADGVLAEGADPMDLPVGVLGILAEQSYRDPWLLLSGEAMPRLMRSICPSISDVNQMAEIDIEAILLAARLVSFGPKIELTHRCDKPIDKPEEEEADEKPEEAAAENVEGEEKKEDEPTHGVCTHENKIVIDVNEHILRYSVIEDEVVAAKFLYEMKRVDQKVHLRPVPYRRSVSQIKESIQRDRQLTELDKFEIEDLVLNAEAVSRYTNIIDMASDTAIDNMASAIFAVEASNGKMVDGEEFIKEWLLTLPTDEAEGLSNAINDMGNWMVSFSEIQYNCEKCGKPNTFRLELDANRLFGFAGDSTPPKKPSRKSRSGARRRKIQ